jgi:hypothetical protein
VLAVAFLFLVSYKVNMDDWQLSRSANIVVIVIIVLILAAIIVLLIVAFNSWNNDNSGSDDGGGGTPADDGAISGSDLFAEVHDPKPAPAKPSAPAKPNTSAKPPVKSSAKPPVKSSAKTAHDASFEDFSLRSFSIPADSVRFVAPDEREPTTVTGSGPTTVTDLERIDGSIDLSARVQLLLNREPMREMSLSSAKTPAFSSAQTPESSENKKPPTVPSGSRDDSGESVPDPHTSSPSTQELEADSSRTHTRAKSSLALGDVLARSSTSYVEADTSGQSISVPASEHPNVPSDFSSLTERPPAQKRTKDPVAALAKISRE